MSEDATRFGAPRNWFGPKEAANYLGVSVHTMYYWRKMKRPPPFHMIGGRVRYPQAALDDWVNRSRR